MLDRYDQDLLLDYLEGELDAGRRAQLDELLAQDTQLASLMQAIARDRAALRALPRAEAPGDLAQDLTQSLERHMLLNDTVPDTGPIPLSRASDRADEPVGGLRWGRVLGLTGLAASVALAAGVVVLTMGPDPLARTADILGETDDPAESMETQASAAPPLNAPAPGSVAKRDSAAGAGGIESPGDPGANPRPDAALADIADALDRSQQRRNGGNPAPGVTAAPAAARTLAPGIVPGRADRNAVALAVIEPPQRQLVLYSDRPEQTRERLYTFCIDNGIPIVRPDSAALADAAGPSPDALADPELDSNALLIDPQQLETVLVRMNNDIVIDAQGFDLRGALSNTAAVVAPIDAGPAESEPALDQAFADSDAQDKTADTRMSAAQPIKLHAPDDLGSDYANSRNSTNLFIEQQRNTLRYAQTQPGAQAQAGAQPPAQAAPAPPEELNSEEHPREQALSQADQPDAPEAGDSVADDATAQRPLNSAIDPVRANLLGPHLPLAQTTPIWAWMPSEATPTPRLVPIRIQRATLEEVNRVRWAQLREQTPLAEPADTEPQPAALENAESEPNESAGEAPARDVADPGSP